MIAEQLEIDAKYAVYLDRQAADVAAFRRDEGLELPDELDYAAHDRRCRTKLRQKLDIDAAATLGQAGRIDGMTPAALTLLVAHRRARRQAEPCRDQRALIRRTATRAVALLGDLFHVKHGRGSTRLVELLLRVAEGA